MGVGGGVGGRKKVEPVTGLDFLALQEAVGTGNTIGKRPLIYKSYEFEARTGSKCGSFS